MHGDERDAATAAEASRRRVCVCVMGLGEMGAIHARNLARVPGVELALASRRAQRLRELADELFAAHAFPSYEAALASPRVDAVVIATKPGEHPAHIIAAARAGKHIFSEKPLGNASADIERALAAVDDARRQQQRVSNGGGGGARPVELAVGFMRRFDPAYVRGRETVASGRLGAPTVLKCTSGDAEYPSKYQRDQGYNSLLLDLSVHDIDLARWLLRSEVRRVYALCGALVYPQLASTGDSDNGVLVLEMESGALCSVHLCRALRYGYNATSELVCQRDTMVMGELKRAGDALRVFGEGDGVAADFGERFAQAFQREMEAFVALVRGGDDAHLWRERMASGRDGLQATRVAEALVRSWRSGRPEAVECGAPAPSASAALAS